MNLHEQVLGGFSDIALIYAPEDAEPTGRASRELIHYEALLRLEIVEYLTTLLLFSEREVGTAEEGLPLVQSYCQCRFTVPLLAFTKKRSHLLAWLQGYKPIFIHGL